MYRKFKNPKISYMFEKTLVHSIIISSKCKNQDEKIFKKEEPIEILKAHRQISKKRCFEKYCSCDKAR